MTKFNHVGFGKGDTTAPLLEQINGAVRHYKTQSGNHYPSITTVLGANPEKKESLDRWRNRIGHDQAQLITSAAASRGTRIHTLAEQYLTNQEPTVDILEGNPIYTQMWQSYKPILNLINNIHCLETRMYSDHLRIAGTADCVAEFTGKLSIIDFKTANKAKKEEWIPDYFMQCTAYAIMYEELTGIPINNLVVLISVENDVPQIFFAKRNEWSVKLIESRDFYENNANSS